MTAGLLGRDDDLSRVGAWLERAASGGCIVGAVRGDAGVGKSRLAAAVRQQARDRGFTVLATHGRAADAEIGFAGLLTLLRPLERDLDALAGDAGGDLRSAMAIGESSGEMSSIQLGVFRVLAGLAERASLLVLIDDADLLDIASSRALSFALGRLDGDSVCVLLLSEAALGRDLQDLVELEMNLAPLSDEAIAAMVGAESPLNDQVVLDVVKFACGNPLAALELVASLTPEEREGRVPLPPVPRPSVAVRRGFEARLAQVSEATRRAMVVVAADDRGDATVILRALEQLGEPIDGLDEAEAVGLLTRDGSRIQLAHPLLRAVAYHQVAAPSRRAAHRALATAYDEPELAVARAWQLAAAASAPDETAAAALELVAEDGWRRGGPGSAARTLERAAALTPDRGRADCRSGRAARMWLAAGDVERASRLVAEINAPADLETIVVIVEVTEESAGPDAALRTLSAASGFEVEALRSELHLRRGDRTSAAASAMAVVDDAVACPEAAFSRVRSAGAPWSAR